MSKQGSSGQPAETGAHRQQCACDRKRLLALRESALLKPALFIARHIKDRFISTKLTGQKKNRSYGYQAYVELLAR